MVCCSDCQIWRMPRPGINLEQITTKSQTRVLYTNNTTEHDLYCPACNLFFDDLDHYHLHVAQREMEKVVERATERVNEAIRNFIHYFSFNYTSLV